jgi:hypothetical protein
MWLAVKKQEFSKGELIGLKRLVRFSAKVPGVCNAKIGTLLKAINDEYHGNGISRSIRPTQQSSFFHFCTVPLNELIHYSVLFKPLKTCCPLRLSLTL